MHHTTFSYSLFKGSLDIFNYVELREFIMICKTPASRILDSVSVELFSARYFLGISC
jgi:hypothetical protein